MIARIWVNLGLVRSPWPRWVAVLLTALVEGWAVGSVVGGCICALAWATMIEAMTQKQILHSSFAFVLPAHRNIPRVVVIGLAVLSGVCLLALSRSGAWRHAALDSGPPAAATFALGAGLSALLALGVFALPQPVYLFMLPAMVPPLLSASIRGPEASIDAWIGGHEGTVLLLGAASMASAWYALEGRRLGRWLRFRPVLGLRMDPQEVRRYRDAVAARRRYAEPMWATALIAWMRVPHRSPSWRAVAGEVVERFGEFHTPLLYGYLALLVVLGVAIGYEPEEMRGIMFVAAGASFAGLLVGPRSRLKNALPLGRRVLFTAALMRSLAAAIAAMLLLSGSAILSHALAPHLPVFSGRARFVAPVHWPHLAAAGPFVGLGTILMSACVGSVERVMATTLLFAVTVGFIYFGIGVLAASALWAVTCGVALVFLRTRYLRRSLV